jgi:hypothetical protein
MFIDPSSYIPYKYIQNKENVNNNLNEHSHLKLLEIIAPAVYTSSFLSNFLPVINNDCLQEILSHDAVISGETISSAGGILTPDVLVSRKAFHVGVIPSDYQIPVDVNFKLFQGLLETFVNMCIHFLLTYLLIFFFFCLLLLLFRISISTLHYFVDLPSENGMESSLPSQSLLSLTTSFISVLEKWITKEQTSVYMYVTNPHFNTLLQSSFVKFVSHLLSFHYFFDYFQKDGCVLNSICEKCDYDLVPFAVCIILFLLFFLLEIFFMWK